MTTVVTIPPELRCLSRAVDVLRSACVGKDHADVRVVIYVDPLGAVTLSVNTDD